MPSREDYIQFFKEADSDGNGNLSLGELKAMLKKKQYRGSEAEIERMFAHVDTSGDGLISLEEYLEAMGEQPPAVHGMAAMRRVFVSFDKDGNGKIDKSELKTLFQELGKHFSDAELTRIMQLYDSDNSGTLDYEEFIKNVFGVNV